MPTGITPFVCLPRGNSQGRLFGDSLYASGTLNNETQFGGKANVPGLDAYDFFARYYDPQLGRFYGLDPVNNPAASPYAYCYNNPLRYVDPTGMLPKVYDDQWSKFVNKWNAGKINSAHIYWPDAGIDIYLTKGDNLNLILAFLVSSDPTKQLPALDERGGGGWVQKHIENTLKAYQGAGPTTNPWQEVMENRGVPAGPVKSGEKVPTGNIEFTFVSAVWTGYGAIGNNYNPATSVIGNSLVAKFPFALRTAQIGSYGITVAAGAIAYANAKNEREQWQSIGMMEGSMLLGGIGSIYGPLGGVIGSGLGSLAGNKIGGWMYDSSLEPPSRYDVGPRNLNP